MNHSTGHLQNWRVAFLLTAFVAACSPAGNGVTDPMTGSDLTPLDARSTPTGTASVNLGAAGDFVILAKSGVSTVPNSMVTGNIGVSPISRAGLTGFSETMDGSNKFSTSGQVVGKLYAADYAVPTPSKLGVAILAMQAAYTDAAGRAPDYTERGAGNIGGMTLPPGTYKWSTGLLIPTDVTLKGGPNAVWIFQIAGTVTQNSSTRVILTGGARARNIFWEAAGVVALGTSAHMEGTILGATGITLATGATVNGRLLAQTAVSLQMNVVTQP